MAVTRLFRLFGSMLARNQPSKDRARWEKSPTGGGSTCEIVHAEVVDPSMVKTSWGCSCQRLATA